ncbi:MAG: putative transcriptional regulator, TetR family [Acidimicrobiia bacterium]|nr:putative transcriptional regulator, TetR family [Acidimicrobiia bacterium]
MRASPFDAFGSRGIATMEVIELAALREFLVRGYDDSTADHIAAAAAVSTRTFFRYFPRGKEDVMVLQFRRWTHQLEQAVRSRPPQESGWAAIRAAVRAIPLLGDEAGLSTEAVELHHQVAMRYPGLHAGLTGHHLALAEPVVEMVALRMSVDPATNIRPRLMVHAMLSASMLAWLAWLSDSQIDPFALFEEALDILEAGVGP